MDILLTGATGFLGSRIHLELSKMFSITTLSRSKSSINVDLALEVPQLKKFDLVVHAAGKAHSVPNSETEKLSFVDVNVRGTQNLLSGLDVVGSFPDAFIFISSVAVYGLEQGVMITENEPLSATDPYGESKIEAEKLISKWCLIHNVKCVILRLPLVAGLNPPGNLKSMINGIRKGFYFNISGGKAKKSIVLAKDVAKILPKAAQVGGVFNLTDRHHPSFFELSLCIATQLGKKQPHNIPHWIAILLAKGGDFIGKSAPLNSNVFKKITNDLTFDDQNAVTNLGWSPMQVLENFKIK